MTVKSRPQHNAAADNALKPGSQFCRVFPCGSRSDIFVIYLKPDIYIAYFIGVDCILIIGQCIGRPDYYRFNSAVYPGLPEPGLHRLNTFV